MSCVDPAPLDKMPQTFPTPSKVNDWSCQQSPEFPPLGVGSWRGNNRPWESCAQLILSHPHTSDAVGCKTPSAFHLSSWSPYIRSN